MKPLLNHLAANEGGGFTSDFARPLGPQKSWGIFFEKMDSFLLLDLVSSGGHWDPRRIFLPFLLFAGIGLLNQFCYQVLRRYSPFFADVFQHGEMDM